MEWANRAAGGKDCKNSEISCRDCVVTRIALINPIIDKNFKRKTVDEFHFLRNYQGIKLELQLIIFFCFSFYLYLYF